LTLYSSGAGPDLVSCFGSGVLEEQPEIVRIRAAILAIQSVLRIDHKYATRQRVPTAVYFFAIAVFVGCHATAFCSSAATTDGDNFPANSMRDFSADFSP
jgi:hypothetical protein